jgi:KUP system potassium uptake protein
MGKNRHAGWLFIGAIGVVFGDLGTSPLYALQSIFHVSGLSLTASDVRGIISLILWSVTLIVTIKYVTLLMRADNHGEGGIMALVGLVRHAEKSKRRVILFTAAGLIGISLFYGDGIVTPAISVLSAIEGTKLVFPAATPLIVPISLLILTGLFVLQARGTSAIGQLFGPIMITWFVVSAAGGLYQIMQHPDILASLLPTTALSFVFEYPLQSFIALSAVILALTGAEALYADMGHFGRTPIRWAWLCVIFPSLVLTYLGQGALVSNDPSTIVSAYYLMFPEWLYLPVLILATFATLIASQAVISGVFSLTWQAVQLGFLPRLTIQHTSRHEFGQIYVPLLNWIMFALVIVIVISFGSSANLAAMFGMAVSGTLLIDTIFLIIVMRKIWHSPLPYIVLVAIFILGLELLFVTASSTKLLAGAWVPVVVAIVSFTVLSTWYKGHQIIQRKRQEEEGTLADFVDRLHRAKTPRVKGYAVYLGHHAGNAPMALHATLDQLHELHERVVVVTVETADAAHVPERSRIIFDELGYPDDGISHLTLRFGYKDIANIPHALELARSKSTEVDFNPLTATYFISVTQPIIVHNRRMAKWRKQLYLFMDRNADNSSKYFKLPLDRTIEMRSFLEL